MIKTKKENMKTKIIEIANKYKFVLIVLAVGLILMLVPFGSNKEQGSSKFTEMSSSFSLESEEERLEELLSQINGAGKVKVYLSVEESEESIIAVDESRTKDEKAEENERETVILSRNDGDHVVTLKYVYPNYRGAVVVSEGAGSSSVRLALTQAVMAATGLGADKITVVKMN